MKLTEPATARALRNGKAVVDVSAAGGQGMTGVGCGVNPRRSLRS